MYQAAGPPLLPGMTMMTPGLAGSLTPRDWTARQLERREHAPRPLHLPRIPRVPRAPRPVPGPVREQTP